MRIYYTLLISLIFSLFFAFTNLSAQAPAQSDAVMLQGFYWDSNSATSWNKLYQISGDISGNFDIVWLPPSAFSSGGTGYMPKQWSNQNSEWGTRSDLQRLIKALNANNCRAMADVVVNHRDGKTGWMDFYTDDFGSYGSFTFTREDICYNDEAQSSASVPANQKPSGAADTGENFDGARDLDHTKTHVQNAVKAYLQWMRNEMGFDGWRYDMVKGFSGSYINGYNAAGGAYLSVGEYWDGQYDAVWNWINATGKSSAAFDFPMKYAALNNGLASGNYAAMAWSDNGTMRPAGLIHSLQSSRYAVTFVDNHDTYRDASKYTGDVLKAYAFILSAPGIPCVFYPHWNTYKTDINNMIKARKSVGLTSESSVEVQHTAGYYKAWSVGTCGEMLTYIGSWSEDPTQFGYARACYGNGWAMYTKVTSTACGDEHQQGLDNAVNPESNSFSSIVITAMMPAAWTAPKIHVWNKGTDNKQITTAAWPGDLMTQVEGNKFTIALSGFTETTEVGIVFNNGAATNALQTIDLSATQSPSCWVLSATATAGGKYDATESVDCFQTAVKNLETDDLGVYPNPATDRIYFRSAEGVRDVTVYSLTAAVVAKASGADGSVDVSGLPSGIYFVKVTSDSGNDMIRRFVKK